uniref:Exocyst complex component 3 n=1 Tax=Aceria tosichella TaxID=561515 RepID=A0A6G1SKV6_9ACAR
MDHQDDILIARVKKAINQGNTGQLRDQVQQNLIKLRKVYAEQLNSAKSSIKEMEKAIEELREVKQSLEAVEKATRDVSMLAANLKPIRDESSRHSQLTTTRENFKHIFDVPQNVATTRQFINEGKLLMAHQHLSELDKSRHALLYELHKNSSSNPNDKITLKQYFSDVDKLSDELGRQIWLIVRRTLNVVRRDPSTIVSALRIIEREERADEMTMKKFEATGFMSPGRPKQWRKRVFDILEEAVAERISGNQFEERSENKHWLVRHLEVTRMMMLEDLRVVKVACVQCFPPSYNIANLMLKLYHKCLRSHLLDLSHHLDGNEYVHLLNWVQAYPGKDLLSHPQLNIDVEEEGLDPLLPESNKQELTDRYFATIEKNYREWMSNTINREERDWSSSEPPEMDNDGHYHTTTPVFIFQMIDQHLRVAETVNQTLEDRILALSMDQLIIFAQQYKETIEKYCKIHFSDRGRYKFFTPYMVAITNNCSRIEQLFLNMEKSRPSAVNAFKALRDEALEKLLKELFLDVGKEINQIGSQDWMDGKVSCVENICLTLDDYYEDYKHLRKENRKLLYMKLAHRMARDYTRALLMKKTNLGNQRQRQMFCDKFIREGKILEDRINPEHNLKFDRSPFQPLEDIKEFLQLRDPDLLTLEVQNLKLRYPDMNEHHLSALLSMSDIIPRRECLKEAKRMLEAGGAPTDQEQQVKTVFSEIQLPT